MRFRENSRMSAHDKNRVAMRFRGFADRFGDGLRGGHGGYGWTRTTDLGIMSATL